MSHPTETLASSATGANHSKRQHSKRGIASVILGLAGSSPFVLFFIVNVSHYLRRASSDGGDEAGPGYGMFVDPVTLLIIALYFLSPFFLVPGLVLGIEELKKADQKRFFPVTGITLSAIFLMCWLLVLSRFMG